MDDIDFTSTKAVITFKITSLYIQFSKFSKFVTPLLRKKKKIEQFSYKIKVFYIFFLRTIVAILAAGLNIETNIPSSISS